MEVDDNMKNAIKKIAVTVFTTASLSALMVGMNANASSATVTDSYSKFYYYRNTSSAGCTLTNSTSKNRYVQASMTVYTADGTAYPSNYNSSLGYFESVSTSYNGSTITGIEYYGTLYSTTSSQGTSVSSWHKTL